MVAGSRLHGTGTIRVASSEGFGNRCTGLSTCVTCPTQNELQCRSLRKRLKWWQPLWENQTAVSGCTQDSLKHTQTLYLSVKNGFPRGSFLANGAVLHSLHRHFVFPIQQLQPPADKNRLEFHMHRRKKVQ